MYNHIDEVTDQINKLADHIRTLDNKTDCAILTCRLFDLQTSFLNLVREATKLPKESRTSTPCLDKQTTNKEEL